MKRFEPIKDESWQSAKARHKRITLKQVEEMKYQTPKQKPNLDDLVMNVCIVCGILAAVIIGLLIF